MTLKFGTKSYTTNDGIPYIWGSGDESTIPSYSSIIVNPSGSADQFGISVAAGCGRIVVGMSLADYFSNVDSGAVYIFDYNQNIIKLIGHPVPAANDQFGWSVAVGCGRIVVGCNGDDVGAVSNAGSAHIYDLNGNYISQLSPPSSFDLNDNDQFGRAVAIGCGKIVVGVPFDNSGAIFNSGSALLYNIDGSYVGLLTHSIGAEYQFGYSVAVGSGRIVVGAPLSPGLISQAGSVHIYDLNGSPVGIITYPNVTGAATSTQFGYSVAVGSGRIVVGANFEDGPDSTNVGAAYIYDLDGNYIKKLINPNPSGDDEFGVSVAVGSGRIVVGAPGEDVNANLNSGAAYVYDLNGNYVGILTHPNPFTSDLFGWSLAIDSGKIVVGIPLDETSSVSTSAGSIGIFSTPNVYTIYDGIDLNYE